jgi:hypothetical protein
MKYVDVKNVSGFIPKIKLLKKSQFHVIDIPVTGDAPKDIVKAYFYKRGVKRSSKRCTYIAKVGHKHYPIETITEYLLNQLGNCFGINMAESEIAAIPYFNRKQIRFFSKYFLSEGEFLIHGADIYAAYYNDDSIISLIEAQKMEKDLITVQEAKKAILYSFPNNPEILNNYCKLLLFDAIVGNNDRHFYNWGCIKSISKNTVNFSPIYDTARGLFWNISDNALKKWIANTNIKDSKLMRYIEDSQPKIGWDNQDNINHFDLVKLLYDTEILLKKEEIRTFFNDSSFEESLKVVKGSVFRSLLIDYRIELITECLSLRFQKLKSITHA